MKRNTVLALIALGVVLVVGVVVSQFASSEPDGLEFVAEQEGFADTARDHSLEASPLADYGTDGPSRAVAAIVGIVVTLGAGYVLFKVVSRTQDDSADATSPPSPPG